MTEYDSTIWLINQLKQYEYPDLTMNLNDGGWKAKITGSIGVDGRSQSYEQVVKFEKDGIPQECLWFPEDSWKAFTIAKIINPSGFVLKRGFLNMILRQELELNNLEMRTFLTSSRSKCLSINPRGRGESYHLFWSLETRYLLMLSDGKAPALEATLPADSWNDALYKTDSYYFPEFYRTDCNGNYRSRR
jgi:hypothetical protein